MSFLLFGTHFVVALQLPCRRLAPPFARHCHHRDRRRRPTRTVTVTGTATAIAIGVVVVVISIRTAATTTDAVLPAANSSLPSRGPRQRRSNRQ